MSIAYLLEEGPGVHGDAGPPPAVLCRRRGHAWRLEWGGGTVLVGDSVGMRHLAALIANPGREIPAIDLVTGPVPPAEGALRGRTASDQPVLDEQARQAYRRRLSEIQAEVDEYESLNDLARAAAARAERDWLLTELTAATGLRGRARTFADDQERARIAVGKAIRRALTRIARADPGIGEELQTTVRTGLRCSYHPR
ncbi:hypothetical protein [Planomonospora venezuelensis]|uniref:Uncharacterized protein n=1 Tax=Planomonospora venezuelensis TaxID=1999 RepID=A0A841D0D4_PLAVE|nr:hypothetical protein [Planomonospora venezuelensis]MBB5963190.1 hypothetical protein [Planomonospora venezuelensis]